MPTGCALGVRRQFLTMRVPWEWDGTSAGNEEMGANGTAAE
jgi:hypothetical protein